MVLHGSKEAKMPSFITIAICGGYIHKMTGLGVCYQNSETLTQQDCRMTLNSHQPASHTVKCW